MVRLLLALAPQGPSQKSIATQIPFLAYSETTLTLVTQFGRLTETTGYGNHTFLKLRHVLAKTCNCVIEEHYQWCPECIHPQSGIGYGLLAHALAGLYTCPLHRRRLRSRCVSCGRRLRASHASPLRTECPYCQSPLWLSVCGEQIAGPPDRCEQQLLDALAYVSDPDLPPPASNWGEELQAGLEFLSRGPACGSYERKELQELRRRLRKQQDRLTLPTLMRLADIQMLEIRTLLMTPKEAFSARLPQMGAVRREAKFRQSKPLDLWFALRRTAVELIELPPVELLPGWGSICELAGVTDSGFWQRFPSVCADYQISRRVRLSGRHSSPVARLFASLYPKENSFSRKPTARGRDVSPWALNAACQVIEKNLAPWMVRKRVPPSE